MTKLSLKTFVSCVCVVMLGSCDAGGSSEAGFVGGYGKFSQDVAENSSYDEPEVTEEAMYEAASRLSGITYYDLGEPYGCTSDCSGHEAGTAWADDNQMIYPEDCGGDSQSFIEGCMAFAEEVQREAIAVQSEWDDEERNDDWGRPGRSRR